MKERGQWQGMMTIARLNWPFYAVAFVAIVTVVIGLLLLPGFPAKLICGVTVAGAVYFLVGSLGVSHFVYDQSDLYRWGWLDRALRGINLHRAIFCHCGFDDVSPELRGQFTGVDWLILDHFDRQRMTEASIRRARVIFPPFPDTVPARYNAWPTTAESADVVFGLLAIHELRSEAERSAWFSESRRCLRKSGRVIIVEHMRDTANFLAFGPGFLHFHSPASWRRCWEHAGFRSIDQFCVTPFVQVIVLSAP